MTGLAGIGDVCRVDGDDRGAGVLVDQGTQGRRGLVDGSLKAIRAVVGELLVEDRGDGCDGGDPIVARHALGKRRDGVELRVRQAHSPVLATTLMGAIIQGANDLEIAANPRPVGEFSTAPAPLSTP